MEIQMADIESLSAAIGFSFLTLVFLSGLSASVVKRDEGRDDGKWMMESVVCKMYFPGWQYPQQ